ncbi:L-serine ammonia-lyase [Cohaesibacter sp. CAU 1516]|uniref:L-serine ammonia-lyase n=1 Tax=Cohaesibacter sp. CAU 1516 TaxID=2576038 RepID=UPI0010FE41F1|nr:L-serine ammonia-lyase [Cohaesibacter sp. CAU 1516]TLP44999.1 L-serine ammonia-lyase [Cohaesibacter sp. CAU 1516]
MFLSVFDIFKIGVGPSSSHTMGPMNAAARFMDDLRSGIFMGVSAQQVRRVSCALHGSLAFTGKGHATDRAVILGLIGITPDKLDPDEAEGLEARIREEKHIEPDGFERLRFNPDEDLVFDYGPPLPGHANGMKLFAYGEGNPILASATYYSIGGGFIVTASELDEQISHDPKDLHKEQAAAGYPYPFGSAAEMLEMGAKSGLTIAEMKQANEEVELSREALLSGLDRLWHTMRAVIDRGLEKEGELPGGLYVKRRAKAIRERLIADRGNNQPMPHQVNDWLSLYAMAVNEENAAGGRVVTAPTNGASGVIPSVLRYYRDQCPGSSDEGIRTFLLTAAAIGGLIKHNASISGAEAGCQAEVGSAAAMAAGGLCAALGGSNEQIENAAEIALEHHLGMTCDPVKGLVQVPCIERNGLGAIKAVSAASLSLHGDGTHFMPLDNCIKTMWETGKDMGEKYKETSLGGLAVNLPEC